MDCNNCKRNLSPDEIDSDGLCYDCANLDPDYVLPVAEMTKELLENSLERLASARGITNDKLKSELVAEHAYNNPDKYIKQVVESIMPKKKDTEKN